MIGTQPNSVLAQFERKIYAAVKPQFRGALDQLLQAALEYTYSPSNRQKLQDALKASTNPPADAGGAAVSVIGMILRENKKNAAATVPAAMLLGAEYLDLLGKAKRFPVTPQAISVMAQSVAHSVMQAAKISPQQLDGMITQGKARMQMRRGIAGAPPMQGMPMQGVRP